MIVRRLSILAVAVLAIGCSSHSAIQPTASVGGSAPQVYQSNGGGQWYVFSTHTKLGFDAPIYWYGSGMSDVGSPGLLHIDERGNTTGQTEPFGSNMTSGEVIGPDGNLWVTDYSIYRVTQGGQTSTYLPPRSNAGPITIGTDGALWFGETTADPELGRITTSGSISEVPFQPPIGPYIAIYSIVTGSDGNFWAIGNFSGIDRITPSGAVTNFPVPKGGIEYASHLALGPDGAVWFAGYSSPGIYLGRMAVDGTTTEFDGGSPRAITFTADGVLWTLTTYGAVQSFDLMTQQFSNPVIAPSLHGTLTTIASGPDGNLWLGTIGRVIAVYLRQSITVVPTSLTIGAPGMTANVSVTETNYAGNWSGSSKNNSVATIKRSNTPGVLTVTAHGVGSTTLDVSDSMHNWVKIPVTVQ